MLKNGATALAGAPSYHTCFMSDDYSFFWIYVWLGILFFVLVVFTLPPKHTDLKNLIGIFTAFVVVTVGGPFTIKSTWDKYHDFASGKIDKIKDLSRTISMYESYLKTVK